MRPRCAIHPEIESVLTCERCGAFACDVCARHGGGLCATCWDAGHGHVEVAWETSWSPLGTLRDMWLSPRRFFGRLGPGSVGRAYLFASLAVAVAFLGIGLAPLVRGDPEDRALRTLAGIPCLAALVPLQGGVGLAIALRIGAALAGVRRGFGFGDAFRLACYAYSYVVAFAPAFLLAVVAPSGGGLLVLATLPLVVGMQLSGLLAYFAGRHGLHPVVAALVAATPILLVVGLCGTVVGMAVYRRFVAETGGVP